MGSQAEALRCDFSKIRTSRNGGGQGRSKKKRRMTVTRLMEAPEVRSPATVAERSGVEAGREGKPKCRFSKFRMEIGCGAINLMRTAVFRFITALIENECIPLRRALQLPLFVINSAVDFRELFQFLSVHKTSQLFSMLLKQRTNHHVHE